MNPVTWRVLAEHGIAVRGPNRDRLEIRTDEAELRARTLANLNDYWLRRAARARRDGWNRRRVPPRRLAASGVRGAPRLHDTIATSAIATKELAAHYALEAFEPRWRALIEDAVACRRGEPPPGQYQRHPARRRHDAAAFVGWVIDSANQLMSR